MAVIATPHAHSGSHTGLGGVVLKIIAAVSAWNSARATRKALSQLSDRELDDIGLSRGDIDHVAG